MRGKKKNSCLKQYNVLKLQIQGFLGCLKCIWRTDFRQNSMLKITDMTHCLQCLIRWGQNRCAGPLKLEEKTVTWHNLQHGIYQWCQKNQKSEVLKLKLRVQMTETTCVHTGSHRSASANPASSQFGPIWSSQSRGLTGNNSHETSQHNMLVNAHKAFLVSHLTNQWA